MRNLTRRSPFGVIGPALCVGGAAAFLAAQLLFDVYWIALTMFGLLGLLNALAWAGAAAVVLGLGLSVRGYLRRSGAPSS